MKSEDLLKLIKKNKYLKTKRKPWMLAMPDSEFYMKDTTILEVNTKSRFIKRLNDFTELNFTYSTLDKIQKLLDNKPID